MTTESMILDMLRHGCEIRLHHRGGDEFTMIVGYQKEATSLSFQAPGNLEGAAFDYGCIVMHRVITHFYDKLKLPLSVQRELAGRCARAALGIGETGPELPIQSVEFQTVAGEEAGEEESARDFFERVMGFQ